MSNGKGCTCYAYGEHECGCGVDWTPQEVYDLRKKVVELEAEIKDKDAITIKDGKWVDIETVNVLQAQLQQHKNKLDIKDKAVEQVVLDNHITENQLQIYKDVMGKVRKEIKLLPNPTRLADVISKFLDNLGEK